MDTIYALATGAPPTAIAILRVSGPSTLEILEKLTRGRVQTPRRLSLRRLYAVDDVEIDQALVAVFAAESSYTGETSAELQLHGGSAVVAAASRALEAAGARAARPGEFSRRALLNGRMDLAQAEGLNALISAETEKQRRHALRLLDGALGRLAADWRAALIEAMALLETGVDFVEEDLGDDIQQAARRRIGVLSDALRLELKRAELDDPSAVLPHIAIIGPPNAGKSSLMNAILGRNAVIVTEIAGTTRDVVTATVEHAGCRVMLMDMAGIREAEDVIERIGVGMARTQARRADHRIFVLSADTVSGLPALLPFLEPGDAVFWNKRDLESTPSSEVAAAGFSHRYVVSARDDSARAAFLAYLAARATAGGAEFSPLAGSERRMALMRRALGHVAAAEMAGAVELAIEELRGAWRALEALVGEADQEAVLDEVFARFCIGK